MNRMAFRIAIYAGTAAGVFWLPFYVRPITDTYSLSQAFHFNNQVAIASLLLGLVLAVWWSWRSPRLESPGQFDKTSDETSKRSSTHEPGRQLGWWPLLVALAASGGELTMVCLGSGWFPIQGAGYFLNRLFLMQEGALPYRDFEFTYGPAMLYVPIFLRRLTGVSIHAAYLFTLWIFAWGGLLLLWWVIREAQASARAKTATFLLLSIFPAVNPESGLQYMMTRFVCGFAALILARMAVQKFPGRWFLVAVCHFLLGAAVLSISRKSVWRFWWPWRPTGFWNTEPGRNGWPTRRRSM